MGRLLPHKQTLDQPKNLAYVMQNAGVFVPDKFFWFGLIFVCKAGVYPSGATYSAKI
jgi:hypothetical protein